MTDQLENVREAPGRYGKHEKLGELVSLIRSYDRGIQRSNVMDEFDLSEAYLDGVLMQAEALGMIDVESQAKGGKGAVKRFFYTPNKQLDIDTHNNDEVVEQVRKALNELKEDLSGAELEEIGFEISIQRVKEEG